MPFAWRLVPTVALAVAPWAWSSAISDAAKDSSMAGFSTSAMMGDGGDDDVNESSCDAKSEGFRAVVTPP